MSQSFYLFLHLVSLFTVLIMLGGITIHMLGGGSKENFVVRKPIAAIHGTALLIAFISGFGLIAKAGYSLSSSPWLYGKMLCWLLLGVFPVIAYKRVLPRWGDLLLLMVVVISAVTLVLHKF
jgi:hypothetical protein